MTTTTVPGDDPRAEEAARGVDVAGLLRHLRAVGMTTADDLGVELVGGGKSNLTFRVGDGTERWILRRPPLGTISRGAHDVRREYVVMGALAASVVPVPRVRVFIDDERVIGAPFYLMDEVDGRVLRAREQVSVLDEDDCRRLGLALVETLADLHEVDVAAVGLQDLGRPEGYLERQLDRWERQFAGVTTRGIGTADRIIEVLRRSQPMSRGAAVVHGDYRIDNVMIDLDDPGVIRAVLDWEMATLGDPLADVGMLAMFWDEPGRSFNPITGGLTAFPGFGSVEDLIERYARRRGVEVAGIDWYLCFSRFKLAVILEQIHVRHAAGLSVGDGFDDIGAMVDQLLAEAAENASAIAARSTT